MYICISFSKVYQSILSYDPSSQLLGHHVGDIMPVEEMFQTVMLCVIMCVCHLPLLLAATAVCTECAVVSKASKSDRKGGKDDAKDKTSD